MNVLMKKNKVNLTENACNNLGQLSSTRLPTNVYSARTREKVSELGQIPYRPYAY